VREERGRDLMSDKWDVFVAGATGLTGSAITKHLLARDPSLRIKGTYHSMPPFLLDERIEYVKTELTSREDCRKAVAGCDSAVLAAAATGGAQSANSEPYRQMSDNLVMDTLLLEAMYLEGIKRIVYLSSATVYQEFNGYLKEDDLDWNQDPHPSYLGVGWAKRAAEKLCQFWHDKYGLEVVILRCANIYGPYAKFDPQSSNFIPALIRKAEAKLDPFEIWGSLDVARDVIFADDVAWAVALSLARRDISFDIFNLGRGQIITVGEVVDLALKYAGHHPKKTICSGDMPTTIGFRALDCNKIKLSLHWEPEYSLAEGIGVTMDWWRKNKESWRK
jgi:nucleoside-diphosphate-sugar epimerase